MGPTSQDVVIPSFLAAYTGRSAENGEARSLQADPLPELGHHLRRPDQTALFNKVFRTFTVKNSYRSTFSIGNYQTNLLYRDAGVRVWMPEATSCRRNRSQWSPSRR
jgi:cell surface protein SprA